MQGLNGNSSALNFYGSWTKVGVRLTLEALKKGHFLLPQKFEVWPLFVKDREKRLKLHIFKKLRKSRFK